MNDAHVHVIDVAAPGASGTPAASGAGAEAAPSAAAEPHSGPGGEAAEDPAAEPSGPSKGAYSWQEQHVCEECAARMDLPSVPTKPELSEIWKLLEQSAKRRHEESGVTCPNCGMTLAEFRAKGRLGCAQDYEVFREHLDPLLERIHNANSHVGRIPGGEIAASEAAVAPAAPAEALMPELSAQSAAEPQRQQIEHELEAAVKSEDYERAAELRDRLRALSPEAPEIDPPGAD